MRARAFGNPDVLAALVEHIDGVARGLSPAAVVPEVPIAGAPDLGRGPAGFTPEELAAGGITPEDVARRAEELGTTSEALLRDVRPPDDVMGLTYLVDNPGVGPRPAGYAQWETEFTDLLERTALAEKTPGRILSEAERVLERDDWRAFSRSRGYTEAEIAEFAAMRTKWDEGVRRFGGFGAEAMPGGPPGAGLDDLRAAYMGAAILHDQTYRRIQAVVNIERDALREQRRMGLIEALDFDEDDALEALGVSFKRLTEIGEANPGLRQHATLGKTLDDLFRKYRTQIETEVRPLYKRARDASGKEKSRAWEDAFTARQRIWAEHDRLADEAIEAAFPALKEVKQQVVDVIQAGATAPEGSIARQGADAYQNYEDVFRGDNYAKITDLMDDIRGNASTKATADTQAALAELFDDVARLVPAPEGSREALDAVASRVREEYDSTFLQYPGNSLDAAMRFVDPYWLYQSRRLGRITKEAIKHPGMVRLYEDYFQNTDQGYINFNGFRHQVDLTRGTLLANLASGRRRGAIVDLEALVSGDPKSALRGDRFPERYDGWAGQVERWQEFASAAGIHPGAMVELALGAARSVGAMISGEEDVLESAELGSGLVVPLAETLLSAVEITGLDTSVIRRILNDPFYQRQLELEFTDQMQKAQDAGLDPESGRDPVAARRAVALDRILQAQTGMTRVRSEEKLARDQARDEVLARRRGITVSEARDLRRTPDFIMSKVESELYEQEVGEAVRNQERRATRVLQGSKLRAVGTAIDEKNERLRLLKFGNPDAPEGSHARNGWKASFDLKVERLDSTPETLHDMASNFWEEFYGIQGQYSSDIPSSREEWDVLRRSYGMTIAEPEELAIAMDELRGIRPEDYKDELGFVQWDRFYADQDDIKNNLSVAAQKEFEVLTGLSDAQSILPHPEAFRLASELWREYNDQPRFIYIDDQSQMQPLTGQDSDHVGFVDHWIGNQLGSIFTRNQVAAFDADQLTATQTAIAVGRFKQRAVRGEFDHFFGDSDAALRAVILFERDREAKLAVARAGKETFRQQYWRVINEQIPYPDGQAGLLEVIYSGAESAHD